MRSAKLLAGVVGLMLLAGTDAAAKQAQIVSDEVVRVELAREHFQRGERLARDGQLEEAVVELELAEVAYPSESVSQTKQRVRAALAAKHTPGSALGLTGPARPRRPLRRFIAPILILPVALGALVSGAAVIATVKGDVARLEETCAPACPAPQVDPLRPREAAGYALLGIGAGLAAVDATLWALLASRRGTARAALPRPSLAIAPAGPTLTLTGAF